MELTTEQRLERLEKLLLPRTDKVKGGANWKNGRRHTQTILERCWPDEPNQIVTILDENKARIYLETYKSGGEIKKRLACEMNRGITLYAQYLPIYKDIIAMMEKVQKDLTLNGDTYNAQD